MTLTKCISLSVAAIAVLSVGCSSNKPAPPPEPPKAAESAPPPPAVEESAIVGQLQSVGPNGSPIVIRTSDGQDHTIQVAQDTEVSSLHDGAVQVAKGAEEMAKTAVGGVKKGTMVAVHFTEKEGKLVASKVKTGSKEVVKETEVVVTKVDEGGRKVWVKTKDGAEHVYEVSKDATIATGKKVSEVGKATGSKIAEGTKATIHFTEQQGQKLMHFMKH